LIEVSHQHNRIVFFDGMCILCNGSVNFLLKKDRKRRLKFSSLQSEFATDFLKQFQNRPVIEDTMIFYDKGHFSIKSTAVLKITKHLGLPYSAFATFLIIPYPIRDWIYDIIARNRVKWFGTMEQCRVPDEATAGRLIG